jgi:hypothetical protein
VAEVHERIGTDVESLRTAVEGPQCRQEFLRATYLQSRDIEAELVCRVRDLTHLQHDFGVVDIAQERDHLEIGDDLAQQLDTLTGKVGRLRRQPGDVAAWSRQACDQAAADRVARQYEHDGDNRCRLLGCRRGGHRRDDDINPAADELGRDLGVTLGTPLSPAVLDGDGAPLDPAQLAQSLSEGGGPSAHARRRGRTQKPDCRRLSWLLRSRVERPSPFFTLDR